MIIFFGRLNRNQKYLEVFILKLYKYVQFSGRKLHIFALSARNCADVHKFGGRISNVYTIDPHDGLGAFDVFCDQTTAGGGWTVLQKRLNGSMDFNRTWEEYKHGFGNFFTQEFWLGLDKIHRLTRNGTGNRLRVELGVTNEELVYAEYGLFVIGNENTSYRLNNLSGELVRLLRLAYPHFPHQ